MKKIFPAKQGATSILSFGLTDSAGAAIPASSIADILLTLWNAEQGPTAYLNSRNALSVKGANGGVVTDGLLTWTAAAADNPIVDQARGIGDTELHGIRLDVTHSASGSPFSEVYGLRVECQRPGTNATPARLRSSPSIALASVWDVLNSPELEQYRTSLAPELAEWIAQGILATSAELETETGRRFQQSTTLHPWTEVLDRECGQRVFQLRAYPVSAIVSVKTHPDGDFDAADAVTLAATDYALFQQGRTGQLMLRERAALFDGPQTLQVTYQGGLASDVHQVPADLHLACVETVRLVMKRTPDLHISGKAQSGGSVTYFRNAPLPTSATAAIARYRCHG